MNNMFVDSKMNGLNILAIEELEQLGISKPNPSQINRMECLLSNVALRRSLLFAKELSRQEVYYLYWLAQGYTASNLARRLDLDAVSLRKLRRTIKRKLNCQTLPQAVFEGIRYGYLSTAI